MKFDDLVIGAGYAGLSVAALLSKRNRRVCVLEAHSIPGGCASYFKRGDFHFDVGATTLSGLGSGMPLRSLMAQLGLELQTSKLERPMVIYLNNGLKLTRYSEQELWIKELEHNFPGIDHRKFWNNLESIANRAWKLLDATEHFPPSSLSDLTKLIKPKLLLNSDLALYFFKSLESVLPSEYQTGPLRQLIDEQLLISTQSYAKDVPLLMAALGLTYPSDMYYPYGGITSLAKKLENYITSHNGAVFYRAQVKEIGRNLKVKTSQSEYEATRIISTIPIWNLAKFNPQLESWQKEKTQKIPNTWSAVTMNLGVRCDSPITPLYHQIHLPKKPHWGASLSLFVSLSAPDDIGRAPSGWQTVTVSTHVEPSNFPERNTKSYHVLKDEIQTELVQILKEHFPQIIETKYISIGTPHTFERYTLRADGLVGGIPHSVNYPAWLWPTSNTPISNLYHLGDTSFPGQGIVGVVQGALNFVKKHHGSAL